MKKFATTLGCLLTLGFTSSVMAQDDFTKGTSYHLIYLDENTELDNLTPSQIAGDFRPNGTTKNLYVWENTYTSPTTSGPNWNGENGAYLSFACGNVGWSGLGFNTTDPFNFSGITSDYTFHIAMKSTASNSHLLCLAAGTGNEGKVCIGATSMVDGGKTYAPFANFTRDGQWHLIEIPMSEFFKSGLRYDVGTVASTNVFFLLSGNNPGTIIDMDAIYIYKKAGSTPVIENEADKVSLRVNQNVVTLNNVSAPIEIFSITGSSVKTAQESTVDCNDLTKGLYIIKSGDFTGKFQVK